MSERHTMVLRWEGDAVLQDRLASCAERHLAKVERSALPEASMLTITMEADGLQELRDAVDALLVDLSEIEDTER